MAETLPLVHRLDAARLRVWDRAVHGLTELAYAALPPTRPSRHGVEVVRDVPYLPGGRPEHRLDVYRPDVRGRPPALVYVHGGGWYMLSRRTHRLFALLLARMGYVVFNVDYRLAPAHPYPLPLADAAAALGFVRDEAERFGADPERLVLAGESAGANLVTALAYAATHRREEPFAAPLFERPPSLRAVVAIYGFHDLHDVGRLDREGMPSYVRREIERVARFYVGHPSDERAREAPLASPLRLIEAPPTVGARPLPPFFLTAGTADPVLDDSRRLERALRARGVPAELHVYEGEVHGFNALLWRDNAQRKWRAVQRFLDRYAR